MYSASNTSLSSGRFLLLFCDYNKDMVTPFYLVHLFRITSANFVFIKVKFSSSKVDHLSIMIFGFNSG